MKFSDKIRFLRFRLSLTQSELAKELRVSFATVNRWENDAAEPKRKHRIRLKQYYEQHGFYDLIDD